MLFNKSAQGAREASVRILYILMKRIFIPTIDFTKVDTLIYHLPNGQALSVHMNGFEDLFDIEMEMGDICDTSEIDGIVHFFPKGNA